MGANAGAGFFRIRPSEKIETHVMTHNAGEEFRVASAPVDFVLPRIVGRRFDRRPGRRPQRVGPGCLVEDFRDVAAAGEHRHTQIAILDANGAPAAIFRQPVPKPPFSPISKSHLSRDLSPAPHETSAKPAHRWRALPKNPPPGARTCARIRFANRAPTNASYRGGLRR